MPGSSDIAETFAQVARKLEAAEDSRETQEQVTLAAVDTIPGCDSAAISLIQNRGRISSVASTDDLARRIDAIQDETGEGPVWARSPITPSIRSTTSATPPSSGRRSCGGSMPK